MRVIYLHGFASSPASAKVQRFRPLLESLGLPLVVPDLNEPNFESLSLSRSIGRVLDLARADHPAWHGETLQAAENGAAVRTDGVVLLIGSSFGGLTAAMAAERLGPRVAGLVLMAPAFDLPRIWDRELGSEGIDQWRSSDALEVDHPAYSHDKYLHWAFYEDAMRHDTAPMALSCPALVFHGLDDDVVDVEVTRRFSRRNPQALVHLLEDGHDLLSSLDFMLAETRRFLEKLGR